MRVSRELLPPHWVALSTVTWDPPDNVLNVRDTPLLIAVIPWGDTVFNEYQCEGPLLREITYLRSRVDRPAHVLMIEELERLRTIVSEGAHHYLWFIGD